MQDFHDHYVIAQELCRLHKQHGLLLSCSDLEHWPEVEKAAPYLLDNDRDLSMKLFHSGFLILLFETSEERDTYFHRTVGEDGPAKLNPYSGFATVFACTFSPDGRILTENT